MTRKLTMREIARLIDARGRISIRRIERSVERFPEYRALLRVRAEPEVVQQLHERFRGNVTRELTPQGHPRQHATWELTGERLRPLLEQLLPYLDRWRDEAQLAIELRTLQESMHAGRGAAIPDNVVTQLEALYQQAKR